MITPQRPAHGTQDDPPSDPDQQTDLPTDPYGLPMQPWPPADHPTGWAGPPRTWSPSPTAHSALTSPPNLAPNMNLAPPRRPFAGWPPAPPLPPPPAAEVEPAPSHRWGFGAFLLAEAVFLVTSFLIVVPFVVADTGLAQPGVPLPAPALLLSLAVPTVLAALVALLITRVRGNGPVIDLRLRFGWRDVGIGVSCGVAGIFITIPLGILWQMWVGEENANSAVGEIFDGLRMNPLLAALVFLNVWLVAPLCEEILYRGLLWGAMERRRWNRWVILAVSTVVFAVAHVEPERAPLLLAIGLPMGLARMLSGRLPAAIIAHQINNFLPALGLMLMLLGVPLAEA